MTRTRPVPPPPRAVRDEDSSVSLCEQIDRTASELNLLSYRHNAPEDFLERRDELVVRLRRLARRASWDRPPADLTTYRPVVAPHVSLKRHTVRTIIVRRS